MKHSAKKSIRLRNNLIKEKDFLFAIYSDAPRLCSARLAISTPNQLKVLLQVLFHLSSGAIPIKAKHFEKIVQARKLATLNRLSEKSQLVSLLQESLSDQKKYARKFISLYPALLFPLFNKYHRPS